MADELHQILLRLDKIQHSVNVVEKVVVFLKTREEQHRFDISEIKIEMKKLVPPCSALVELKSDVKELSAKQTIERETILQMKARASVWGAVAGAIITFLFTIAVKIGDVLFR